VAAEALLPVGGPASQDPRQPQRAERLDAWRSGTQPRGCVKQKGHTPKDVLRFFKQIDASVPRGLAVHVVLDNLSAHKAPEITTWLSHRDRRRWHLHFTPRAGS